MNKLITGIIIGIVFAGLGDMVVNIDGYWIFYILMPFMFGMLLGWQDILNFMGFPKRG